MAVRAAELEVIVTADASQATDEINATNDALGRIGQFAVGEKLMQWGQDALGFAKNFIVAGADFAQEMAFVDKLTGDSGQYFQALQDKALQMGEKTIFSAQEAAQGMEQLAREGFTPAQIIGTNAFNSMIDGAANMAAALRINLDDAANMLGMTMRSYADTTITASQATDTLTQAALRSGKSASEFNSQLAPVLSTADQLHLPLEQAAGAVAMLMSQNVPNAGGSLRAFLVGVTTDGTVAYKAISQLGINARDALAQGGLPELIDEINKAMQGMSPDEQSKFIKDMSGGNKQVSGLIQLLRDGGSGLDAFITKMRSLGSAASVMAALIDTTAGSFHILSSSIFTAEKVMGDAVDGYIKPLVDAAAALVNAFIAAPPVIHLVAAALVILGGIAMTLAGGLLIAMAIGIGNVAAAAAIGIAAVAGIAAVFGLFAAALVLAKPRIDTFLSAFDVGKQAGFNTFQAALFALSETFPSLSGVFDGLRAKVTELGTAYDYYRKLGLDPFNSAMQALESTFRSAIPAIEPFRQAGESLIAAWGQGGLRGVLLDLPNAIRLVADGLVQAGILLAPVVVRVAKWTVSQVEDLAGDVTKFVSDHWKDIKDAGYDAVGYAIRLGKWALRTVDNLSDAVQKWVKSAWPTVRDVGYDAQGYAIRLGKWAIKETDKLSDAVSKWVKDNLNAANLSDVGKTISDKVAAAINAIPWGAVGQTLGYGLGTALAAGIKLAGALVAIAVNALKDGQLYTALYNAGVHLIEGFAKGFGDAIQQQFPGLAGKVTSAWAGVKHAFDDLPKPIQDAAKAVGDAIHDITKPVVGLALAAIGISFAFDVIAAAATVLAAPLIAAGLAAAGAAPEILIIAGAAFLAYEGFKHWDTIAGYIQKFGDVTPWAAAGATALAVALGALDPPLGLLILASIGLGEVVSHFGALKDAVKDLGDAISAAWQWIDKLAHIAWGKIDGADALAASLGVVAAGFNGLATAFGAAQAALNWIANHVGLGAGDPHSTANQPYSGADPALGGEPQVPNYQYYGPGQAPPGVVVPPGPSRSSGPPMGQTTYNQLLAFQQQYGGLGSAGGGDLPGGIVPGLGGGIGSIQTSLMGGGGGDNGGAATFQQMTAKVNGQAQALVGQLGAAGTAAGQAWARGLGAGLQTGLAAVTSVITAVSTIATSATGRLASAGTAAGQGWARALGAGLQTGLTAVAAVTNAINTIVSALTGRLIADGTTSGQGWARGLGTGLQTALTAVVAVTNAIATIMTAWGTRTVQVGQQTGQQFAVAWGQGLQLALTATTAVTTAMSTIVTTAFNAMRTTVQTQATAMATAATSAFTTMRANVANAANAMNSGVSSAFNAMRSSGSAAVGGLAASVASSFNAMRGQAISAAQSMMAGVVGAINAGAGAAAGAAYNAGVSIGAGLANGMNAELGAVQAAAAALAGAAAAAAAASLGVASPSKVFHRIGLFVGEGFAAGIRESMANAANVVRSSTLGVVQATEGAVNQALARPGATVAAGRGGGTVVYVTNNNTVRVDDLPDVIRAAQFVRDSDSVRQLIMGTT